MTVKPNHMTVHPVDPRLAAKFCSEIFRLPAPKPFVFAASALRGLGTKPCQ